MSKGLPLTGRADEHPIEDIDLRQFEQLVKQESHTWEGQIRKLQLIEGMIAERVSLRQHKLRMLLLGHEGQKFSDETFLKREIEARVPSPRIKRLKGLRDGGYTLIVTKEGPRKDDTDSAYKPLRISIPAHADAVESKEHLRILKHNPSDPDQVMARMTYDMGAAVLNNIALAADLDVPEGMVVDIPFTMGEETHSDSAKMITDPAHWRAWNDTDIVLSSEIGHADVPPEGDHAMRYIMGRRGREKFELKVDVAKNSQGHFANPHVRSATHALGEALYLMNDRFHHCNIVAKGEDPRQRTFLGLDPEKLEFATSDSQANDGRTTSSAESGSLFFNVQTVPGRDGGQSLERELNEDLERIARHCEWVKHGISYTLLRNTRDNETSYLAYEMPSDHVLGKITAGVLEKVAGVPAKLIYGRSVADENLYAHALLKRLGKTSFREVNQGVVSIPIIGDNPHEDDEWVSLRDMIRVRRAVKMLIEDESGFRQLIAPSIAFQRLLDQVKSSPVEKSHLMDESEIDSILRQAQ